MALKPENLTTEVDDWLDNHMVQHVVWCAILSNSLSIIQDDEHPDKKGQVSAWERLSAYCKATSNNIVSMKLQFRTVIKNLEIGKDGVFFCKSVIGGISGNNVFSYLTGTLDGDILKVVKWRTPDLERVKFIDDTMISYRNPKDCPDCIIRHNNEY